MEAPTFVEVSLWESIIVRHVRPLTDSSAAAFGANLEFHVHSLDGTHAIFASGTLSEWLEIGSLSRRIIQFVGSVDLSSEKRRPVEPSRTPRGPRHSGLSDDVRLLRRGWRRA